MSLLFVPQLSINLNQNSLFDAGPGRVSGTLPPWDCCGAPDTLPGTCIKQKIDGFHTDPTVVGLQALCRQAEDRLPINSASSIIYQNINKQNLL